MSSVLDASATIEWFYQDTFTASLAETFRLVEETGAWVPSLWHLEVGNVLQIGIRRRRHDRAFRDKVLQSLSELPIQVDAHTCEYAWSATVLLAERHGLTIYDATYLELAMRRSLPLASLDNELRKAAMTEGVILLT